MIKPLKGLILIRIKQKAARTQSGLYLPQEKWPKPENIATVIAVGPEVKTIKVDNECIVNPYAVHDTDDREVKLIDQRDILATWD